MARCRAAVSSCTPSPTRPNVLASVALGSGTRPLTTLRAAAKRGGSWWYCGASLAAAGTGMASAAAKIIIGPTIMSRPQA
jgi:hypothetical protein|eukprot:COSAG01_NODE_19190_length_1025_cov_1.062635_1_plen_80_part_00